MRERRGRTKDCGKCPDRALCDIVDDGDIQFWPEDHRLEEVSGRFGRSVSQLEYQRVRECLLAGRWAPVKSDCCGPEKATGERIHGERATASSTTNPPNAKGGMNAVIVTVPSALRERLGDDGARALVELLRNTGNAQTSGESIAQDIQSHVDYALDLVQFRMKTFIVTVTLVSVSFLTLLLLALQVGQALSRGT